MRRREAGGEPLGTLRLSFLFSSSEPSAQARPRSGDGGKDEEGDERREEQGKVHGEPLPERPPVGPPRCVLLGGEEARRDRGAQEGDGAPEGGGEGVDRRRRRRRRGRGRGRRSRPLTRRGRARCERGRRAEEEIVRIADGGFEGQGGGAEEEAARGQEREEAGAGPPVFHRFHVFFFGSRRFF